MAKDEDAGLKEAPLGKTEGVAWTVVIEGVEESA